MSKNDLLPREVRDFVRFIAYEDGTSFHQAMKGYDALQALLKENLKCFKREASRKPTVEINPLDEVNQLKERILASRRVFSCNLLEAVRLFNEENVVLPELKVNRRKCREKGCKDFTTPTSYYRCEKHMHDWADEDSDFIYCPTMNGGEIEAFKAGVKKLAEKVAAEMAGKVVFNEEV